MSKSPKIVFKIFICLISVGIGFVLSEIFLFFLGVNFPIFIQTDPQLGTRLIPNAKGFQSAEGNSFFSTNSRGFNNVEVALKKPENTIRIVVLGDSYTEARQVERSANFCTLLESKLNSKGAKSKRYQVLNFGVSGYGTLQELLLLQNQAQKFDPDYVILAFLTGNDVRNNSHKLEVLSRPFYKRVNNSYYIDYSFRDSDYYLTRNSLYSKVFIKLTNHSRILQLINQYRLIRKATRAGGSTQNEIGLDDNIYHKPDDIWTDAWLKSESLIKETKRFCDSIDAKFLLFILSNPIQVHPDANVQKQFMDKIGVPDLLYPENRLVNFANLENIDYLSFVLEHKKIVSSKNQSLHGFDSNINFGHWNQAGHLLASEFLYAKIKD